MFAPLTGVVGGLLTYVDDFLLGGSKEVITALAKAIQEIWKTTPLTTATPDTSLRFLGVEILVQGSGFVLSQQAYAEAQRQTRSRTHRLSSCELERKGSGSCYPRCRASVSIHPAHRGLCSHRGSG